MNPFDLPGPQFLFFYVMLALGLVIFTVVSMRSAENGHSPRIDFGDPYRIAHLRGGKNETLRVATVSLVDRGLLRIVGDESLVATDERGGEQIRHPVEAAIVEDFRDERPAKDIFTSTRLEAACTAYERDLVQLGLLPDAAQSAARDSRFRMGSVFLVGVTAVKVWVAFQRGRHNVIFLLILTVLAIGCLYAVTHPRRTSRGSNVLADLRQLFASLRGRSDSVKPGGASGDALLLAAVFGIGALPAMTFPHAGKLFPKSSSQTTSGNSSCGSSCGTASTSSCGSSCGGGGCGGGCGGCGS